MPDPKKPNKFVEEVPEGQLDQFVRFEPDDGEDEGGRPPDVRAEPGGGSAVPGKPPRQGE